MLLEFDGTFIFALISFLIFVGLMNLVLYRPVTKIIAEREKFLLKNSQMASASKQKAKEAIEEKEAQILSAKVEASNILQNTQNALKSTREAALNKIKNETKQKVEENNSSLQKESAEVSKELEPMVKEYVSLAVSKVLGEELK